MSQNRLARIESKASSARRSEPSGLPPVPKGTQRFGTGVQKSSPKHQEESSTSGPSHMLENQNKGPSEMNTTPRSITPSRNLKSNAPRLPTINSASSGHTKRVGKNPYEMNYSLQIESDVLDHRQHQYRVNNYYSRLITKRIFNSVKPTPVLAQEKRNVRNMQKSLDPISIMRHNASRNQNIDVNRLNTERESTVLKGQNTLQTDDSIFGGADDVSNINASKLQGRDTSRITDMLQNTTLPATSRSKQEPKYDTYESTQITDLMDPLAGNSVVTFLNNSLHADALFKIDNMVNQSARKRSRQRRKNHLLGEASMQIQNDHDFHEKGNFEHDSYREIQSQNSKVTETETLANSSVFNLLRQESPADSFKEMANEFSKMSKKVPVLSMTQQPPQRMSVTQIERGCDSVMKDDVVNFIDSARSGNEDPELHFKKLKAKIKLKVVKKYTEDKIKKLEEDKIANVPVVVVKDRFGRIMERQHPLLLSKKVPNANRLPRKVPKVERKMEFATCQLEYHDFLNCKNPKDNMKKPTMMEQETIKIMKSAKRYPVPEQMMGRSRRSFRLAIDTIMTQVYSEAYLEEWADYRQEVDAPYNSNESEDEFHIYQSQDDDEELATASVTSPTSAKHKLTDPLAKEKIFNKQMVEPSPFRIESVKTYPFKFREGEVPLRLLKVPKIEFPIDSQLILAEQQKDDKRWDNDFLQSVFEFYCMECSAAPLILTQFMNYSDPNNVKLSIKNYHLDEPTAKALACVVPFMIEVTELELHNNQLTDPVAGMLALAFFMNPSLTRLSVGYNYLRSTFTKTLAKLIGQDPCKITHLNLMGSITFADHLEPLSRVMPQLNKLVVVSVAGCGLSQNSCRTLARLMMQSKSLHDLDVSHCKISFQGTRYLIDALNRNANIRNFNFSHNDLQSQSFEFSIKVASMLTRHPTLMHLNIAHTNLKREEMMFIGLSLSTSKTVVSLHLSGQTLPYYERIFLRAVIAARVGYGFKNLSAKKDIGGIKERNQVIQMATGEPQAADMLKYIDLFQELENNREGLDFEIQDLLDDIDTQATFENLTEETRIEDLPAESKVATLIKKIMNRQQEIEAQQEHVKDAYKTKHASLKDQLEVLADVKNMSMYNLDKDGKPKQEVVNDPNQNADLQDVFQQMKELKVDRQRVRAEQEITKEQRERSAGELALMFMGINQITQEQLAENPMTGYMNEIVFSRILGEPEIEQGAYWTDSTQCWVCQKWNKIQISYNPCEDKKVFQQKVEQIENLKQTIEKYVKTNCKKDDKQRNLDDMIEIMDMDDLQSVQTAEDKMTKTMQRKSMKMTGAVVQNRDSLRSALNKGPVRMTRNADGSRVAVVDEGKSVDSEDPDDVDDVEQKSVAQSDTTVVEEVAKPHLNKMNDETNPMGPIEPSIDQVRKVFQPNGYQQPENFELMELYEEEETADIVGGLKLRLKTTEGIGTTVAQRENKIKVTAQQIPGATNSTTASIEDSSAQALQRQYMMSQDQTRIGTAAGTVPTMSIMSQYETKKRKHGEPAVFKRQVFFEGMVYMIEEEVYSDSDHSSVYTSEDDFEVCDTLQEQFSRVNPLKNKITVQDGSNLASSVNTSAMPFNLRSAVDNKSELMITENEPHNPLTNVQNSLGTLEANSNIPSPSKIASPTSPRSPRAAGQKNVNFTTKPQEGLTKVQQQAQKMKQVKEGFASKVKTRQQDITTETEGLTQEQQDYESKTKPRHFKPAVMDRRVMRFDEMEEEKKKRRQKKGQTTSDFHCAQGPAGGYKDKEDDIFIVCSFNDWMPLSMKTLRTLHLEKHTLGDERLPKQYFLMDNQILIYANMASPGAHFFYFAREGGEIFLSPKYEVVRFKKTNVYLNRIIIKPRLDAIVVAQDHTQNEEEAIFMKDRSVFKDFREDTVPYLRKCLDQDVEYSKLPRLFKKDPEELALVTETLFKNYEKIINIFAYYAGSSSYPTVSMNDFTSFANQTSILDHKYINLAALDLLFVATNVSANKFIQSAERDLNRYEFVEMIVRTALFRFKDTKLAPNTCKAIEMLLEELIYPNARSMNGEHFRKYYCYNLKINEILQKNETQIKKVYDSFHHLNKHTLRIDEAQALIRKVGLKVSEMQVGAIYVESMMTILDTISDRDRNNRMTYVEFLVFLCRISHEHYEGTPYKAELNYLKLDHLMPAFLSPFNLAPAFAFGEKFEVEAEIEMKKLVRRRRKLETRKQEAINLDVPIDQALQAEITKLEEIMHKTGMSEFRPNEDDASSDSNDDESESQPVNTDILLGKLKDEPSQQNQCSPSSLIESHRYSDGDTPEGKHSKERTKFGDSPNLNTEQSQSIMSVYELQQQ